jgi:hypothetical protein
MDKKAFDKWISSLSPLERANKAKEKLPKLVDHLLNLIALHANNEIVTYSPKLASQIPASHAANAFNVAQYALHRFELIRICAFWDSSDPEKENLATVVALVDDPAVAGLVTAETAAHWANTKGAIANPAGEAELREIEIEMLRTANLEFGNQMSARDRAWLSEAIAEAKSILGSEKLRSTMNLRDKALAHSLSITNREKRGVVQPMKYGYEKDLLEAAIRITEKLYCSVNGTSFDFKNSWRISRSNSAELWGGCKFDFSGDFA